MVPTVTVTGSSGSGKTTFIERVLPRLRAVGLRVGTVKHASHGFEADRPGSDSHRHAAAGADPVVLVGPDGYVTFHQQTVEIDELLTRDLGHLDLVLVEGLASRPGTKILVHRSGVPPRALPAADDLLFVLTDDPQSLPFGAIERPVCLDPTDLDRAVDLIRAAVVAHRGSANAGLTAGRVEDCRIDLAVDGGVVDLDDVAARAAARDLFALLPSPLATTARELVLRVKLR